MQRAAGNLAVSELLQSSTSSQTPVPSIVPPFDQSPPGVVSKPGLLIISQRALIGPKTDGPPPGNPVSTLTLRRKCACAGSGAMGECEECRKKQDTLERRASGPEPDEVPLIVHEVLRSTGRPLDPETRAFFEPRFGHDFSQVRVHTDAKAAESARAVNAQAFTAGNHLVFAAGRYQPQTAGKRLLAHELTHVVQQKTARSFGHFGKIRGRGWPILQRQAGWSDALGWNKQSATVYQSGTTTAPNAGASSVSRIPLEGLTEGSQDPSMTKKVTEMQVEPETSNGCRSSIPRLASQEDQCTSGDTRKGCGQGHRDRP